MIYKFKKLIKRYKELILYGLFGVLTTIINIVIFYVLNELFPINSLGDKNYIYASIIAFTGAVIFAFITNKYLVFKATNKENIKNEFIFFMIFRIFSLTFDLGIMYLCVDLLFINDMISKVIANIIVIILNFIFSKLIIFKK